LKTCGAAGGTDLTSLLFCLPSLALKAFFNDEIDGSSSDSKPRISDDGLIRAGEVVPVAAGAEASGDRGIPYGSSKGRPGEVYAPPCDELNPPARLGDVVPNGAVGKAGTSKGVCAGSAAICCVSKPPESEYRRERLVLACH
jgi:hypothetical protein